MQFNCRFEDGALDVAGMCRKPRFILALLVALVSCGTSTSEESPAPPDSNSSNGRPLPGEPEPVEPEPVEPRPVAGSCPADELAVDLETHACYHLEHGPFASVATSAEATAPSVSEPHTAFTVDVSAGEDRWLSFKAKSSAVYAFYSGPKARIVLRRSDGQLISAMCEGATSDACPALPYQVQAQLNAEETVGVALFPDDDAEQVKLVIESVE